MEKLVTHTSRVHDRRRERPTGSIACRVCVWNGTRLEFKLPPMKVFHLNVTVRGMVLRLVQTSAVHTKRKLQGSMALDTPFSLLYTLAYMYLSLL